MKTMLIALAALAVADFAFLAGDIEAGAEFEVDAADAEGLLTAGKAKLATPAPSAASAPPKAVKKVKARVLGKCAWGEANDLVDLDADEAKVAEADGLIDTNKAAVTYAASLDQNKA